jgi:preprotein translocase subunit SecB
MADETTASNGAAAETKPQVQARLVSQYLKDLSFENPNVHKLITGPGEAPKLSVTVNVSANQIEGDLFESAIELKATAVNNVANIYVLECVYAGVFKIETMPQQALEPFLLISGPTMVFPFLRRLVADVTREGGYPPLLLDPIDFANLYLARQKEAKAGAAPAA